MGHPAAIASDALVQGELHRMNDESVLRELDEIEGFRPEQPDASLYLRLETTVTLSDGANNIGTTAASNGGAWSFTTGPNLPNVAHVFMPTTTDAAGNVAGPVSAQLGSSNADTLTGSSGSNYGPLNPALTDARWAHQ